MPGGRYIRIWARTVLVLAVALLAGSLLRTPAGLTLAAEKDGFSFELKAAFVRVAFDIGQKCSISNRCLGVLA